jgi:uncharacterized protein (DUF305 family)
MKRNIESAALFLAYPNSIGSDRMIALLRCCFLGLIVAAPMTMAADDTASSAGSKAIHDAMMKGMSPMHSMQMSGDPDRDFAMMMIQHHQQAIDMSRAELKHGKNADVRKKAQEIIDASQKDIAELKKHEGTEHDQH